MNDEFWEAVVFVVFTAVIYAGIERVLVVLTTP
jgi:hypothetical protein